MKEDRISRAFAERTPMVKAVMNLAIEMNDTSTDTIITLADAAVLSAIAFGADKAAFFSLLRATWALHEFRLSTPGVGQ